MSGISNDCSYKITSMWILSQLTVLILTNTQLSVHHSFALWKLTVCLSPPQNWVFTSREMKTHCHLLILCFLIEAFIPTNHVYVKTESYFCQKTHIDKIQTKQNQTIQNHSARLIFFATAHGEHTESALPLLNLLDVLTVHNVYRFQILRFMYLCIKASCQGRFQIIFNVPVMYTNTIPGMHRSKTCT